MQQVQNTQNAQNNAFNAATSPPLTHYLAAVRLGKEEIKEIHITGIPPSMKKKRKGHRKELLREKHNFQRTNITSSSNKNVNKVDMDSIEILHTETNSPNSSNNSKFNKNFPLPKTKKSSPNTSISWTNSSYR
jgi:lipid II:glycine glycyltransferase (peptidoglycan interpeptide bridge formation enzyme)